MVLFRGRLATDDDHAGSSEIEKQRIKSAGVVIVVVMKSNDNRLRFLYFLRRAPPVARDPSAFL